MGTQRSLREHGEILLEKTGVVVVRMQGDMGYLLDLPEVCCENPGAPARNRIYHKKFRRKSIFLPGQEEVAREAVLAGRDTIVVGMTGYSQLTDQQCLDWGIPPGAYECACMDIFGAAISALRAEYPGILVKIVHGSSATGVDNSVIEVARRFNLDHLGYSCPEYMFYVLDDEDAVYVSADRSGYSDAFIRGLQILISVGGRVQSLEHDISGAIRHNKRLLLVPVLQALSSNGGPPARDFQGRTVDATAAFAESISLMGGGGKKELYEAVRAFVVREVVAKARFYLSPGLAFATWTREMR